jgi:hypothetical protein
MHDRRVFVDSLGWGIALWLIGYVLGIVLFFVLPTSILGWFIMPVGVLITLWVLLTRIQAQTVGYFAILSVLWTVIAVVFDYLFIVLLFKPQDGYYKLDVYVYYLMTCVLPLAVGWWKSSHGAASPHPAG